MLVYIHNACSGLDILFSSNHNIHKSSAWMLWFDEKSISTQRRSGSAGGVIEPPIIIASSSTAAEEEKINMQKNICKMTNRFLITPLPREYIFIHLALSIYELLDRSSIICSNSLICCCWRKTIVFVLGDFCRFENILKGFANHHDYWLSIWMYRMK